MREIKFRAWDGGVMLYSHDGWDYETDVLCEMFQKYIEYGYTLMQYTGLKDKNGKEIYEDTLLKDPQGNVGKVFYSADSASFLINWKRKDGSWDTDPCFGYGEVIGNIHENPELLGDNQ